MKEDFLYYLWENRLLKAPLCTADGQAVEIVNTGYRNLDSGPDFMEAKIKIGETLWAGHVEIHVLTSDWNRHHHQHDKAYDNVVLHVVFENDSKVNDIPVLALKGHFDNELYENYQRFKSSQGWIPCEKSLGRVQRFTWISWFDRLLVERLEMKAASTEKILRSNQYDWEDTLYKMLLRYFGLKVNNEAFEYLGRILPFKTLLKHADNLTQTEAMLFGCAGFLERGFTDAYPTLLTREFAVMKAKFNLLTMPEARWKYLRMRPGNFPTIRLAQIAQMIHQHGCLFSKIRSAQHINEIRSLFMVPVSPYWEDHYRFDIASKQKCKHLGESTADILTINVVIPILFCFGKLHNDMSTCERAMRLLEELEAESNTITRHFAKAGIQIQNAMQSQATIQLYTHYCKLKRCLECRIGNVLMKD